MKRVLLGVVVLLLIGVGAYAADGDLIVNGNVGIGTATPSAKLDVVGGMAITLNGVRLVPKYINSGEDSNSGNSLSFSLSDTCNGDYVYTYSCPATMNGNCNDVFAYGGYWWVRTMYCRAAVIFTSSEFLP